MAKSLKLPDKNLSRNGLDIVLPIAMASQNQLGAINKLLGVAKRGDKTFVRLNRFVIKWKPTCPPEMPGTFGFDFYFDGGDTKYTIIKGSGMVGHAVEITISTSIYISLHQLKSCPYKLDISPNVETDGACGSVSMEVWVSNGEKYPKHGKRNVSIHMDPPDRHGLPSIFYHINPNNDQYYTNIQQLIPISEDIIDEYSALLRDCFKISDPSIEDALVLRYMINPDEEMTIQELNSMLRDNKPITTKDSIYLVNLSVRFSGSTYRKFISGITGQLEKETPTSTSRF
ncbi:putative movement protein [Potato yellow dwarf virus]|uniref:Movement protein n=2 Tax=Alphanucleorhabdovirus tuberosum TaxID=2749927 RepID=A0A8F8QQJ6_9RHAB|nr:putative movement protein [Potato yellow dwarf virus]ADE45271.1 putative movement protein [Potato yellow dwarf virus]QYA72293.1 movement protein [Alphanucleorhabdovirus tuberosum]